MDRSRSSRSRSRSRSRDRKREKERDRERSRDRRKRERSRERDRSRGRDSERDREKDRTREKEKDRGEKDRTSERGTEREKGKDKRDVPDERSKTDNKLSENGDRREKEKGSKGDSRELSSQISSESGISDVKNEMNITTDGYAAVELEAIEKFLEEEEEEDEDTKAERLAAERRKRREEIMKTHKPSTSTSAKEPDVSKSGLLPGNNSSSGRFDDDAEMETGDKSKGKSGIQGSIRVTEDPEDGLIAAERERNALAEEQKREVTSMLDIFSAHVDGDGMGQMDNTKGGGGRRALRAALLEGEDPHLQSNWDDGEGYYSARVGELICDRYQTLGVVGKGVFSTVVRCLDVRTNSLVAVKMIRNNDIMKKAAEKELSILSEIAARDPENKRHCVRILANTEYRNHVTLIFESLHMNLREVIKKFGKNVGLNASAVRMYGRQLLIALRHLAELRVVHADIKPDNILVSEDLKQVKLCDFGSAFRETDTDNDITPYLQSRFYRAPEIMLGLIYDRQIDLWSIGVCLYELFTGHVMYPGRTNNEMLRLHMETKGRFPHKLLRAHLRAYEQLNMESHFDSDLRFKQVEPDPVTGKLVTRKIEITQPTKELSTILFSCKAGADDRRIVSGLVDLLDKILTLDPSKRISVSEALRHSLFVKQT